MRHDPLFQQIRSRIDSEDLSVEPLASPWKRTLLLFPLWALMVMLTLSVFGLRSDYYVLRPWVAWTLTLPQLFMASLLLFLGFKSVIPGMASSKATLALASSGAVTLHVFLCWFTLQLSSVGLEPLSAWRTGLACLLAIGLMALPPMALTAVMAASGLPLSPLRTGLLLGLVGALSGEAAWRMHCAFTSPGHVLSFHTGAVVLGTLIGLLGGWRWQQGAETREG